MPLLSLEEAMVDGQLEDRVGAWGEAIPKRFSRRTYRARPVAPKYLVSVAEVCHSIRTGGGARCELIEQAPHDLFKGLVGGYGRISGAPSALAFCGPEHGTSVEVEIGYAGEAVVLEATALGLDTCWVSGTFRPQVAESLLDLPPGERVWAVSPLGHAEESLSTVERLVFRQREHSGKPRKRLEEIAPGISDDWPEWATRGVRAARLAPSAVNRQPWRFVLEHGRVACETDGGIGGRYPRRLDCGIAMLHFEVAARAYGVAGRWEITEESTRVGVFETGAT